MKPNYKQSAMDNLIGSLSSPTPESSFPSAPVSSSEEAQRPVKPKKVEQEQISLMMDKPLMQKIRALAYQEGCSVKEVFTVCSTKFINEYEEQYGKLPVAKPKSGGLEKLVKK